MRNPSLEEKALISIPNPDQLIQQLSDLAETEVQEKKPYSLQMIAPLLDIVFSHLNHLKIYYNPDLDQEPYVITLANQEKQLFTRRVFHTAYDEKTKEPAKFTERGPEMLPVFSMTVAIGPAFNVVKDLPEFTQQVQALHNKQMREYGLAEEEPVYINTNKQLAEYWQFMADQLVAFVDLHVEELRLIGPTLKSKSPSLGESVLLPTVRAYSQLCGLLAEGFGSASNGSETALTQEVDNTPWLEIAWKQTEHRLLTMLGDLQARADDPNSALATDPARFIRLLVNLTTHHAQQKMIEELNTQARSAFFHHCEAELWRKAGLGDIWQRLRADDDVVEVVRAKKAPDDSINFFKEFFPENTEELLELKHQLLSNKQALDSTRDIGEKRELLNARVDFQLQLIEKLRALVFSGKIFNYKPRSYSFSDAIENSQVNCMVRAELFHQWYGYFGGEATLAVVEPLHFFSVVKLANGALISMDDGNQLDKKNRADIGNHELLYLAGLADWKACGLMDSMKLSQAETLIRESIRIGGRNASFLNQLAVIIMKGQDRLEEVESLYREAIERSNSPLIISNLILLISKDVSRKREVEELMLRLVELEPENFDYTRKLADFYFEKMKDKKRALQWYEKTLAILDEFSTDSLPNARTEIRKRMKRIQRSRKIKDLFRFVQRIGLTSSAPKQT